MTIGDNTPSKQASKQVSDMASDTDLWVVVDGSERLECMLVLHKGHKSKLLEIESLIYRLAQKQTDVFLR